ncbi:protein N-terminal asparagine amidohydrolase-like [Artemia franciscana]|uniref:protein N-terminal asparagine amidohydrolase-like n=1 Tax=Artemia franciscana TaxID=6661 RepID=UPI0032D9F342
MPIVISGVPVEEAPPDTRSLFLGAPNLKDAAAQFTVIPSKMVGSHGLIYVGQREFASTVSHDKNVSIIGSDDCTTCLIVILRHTDVMSTTPLNLDPNKASEYLPAEDVYLGMAAREFFKDCSQI